MAIKKRTDQLPAILSGDVDNNDLMYLVHENAQAETGYDSKKIFVSDVGRKLNNGIEYATELPSFPSGSQNPLDALELLKQEILDLYPVDSASGAIANFTTSLALPLVALKAYIQAQGGGGTPSAPVAITGWDNVNLYRRGGNLWNEDWEAGEYNVVNGNKINTVGVRCKEKIAIKGGATYRIFSLSGTTNDNIGYCFYDKNENYISGSTIKNRATATAPDNARYLTFFMPNSWYGSTYKNDTAILDARGASSYEPYNPQSDTFTISLGQTVYGGYVDWSTGKLVITYAIVDMGNVTWNIRSGTTDTFYHTPTGAKILFKGTCSCYPKVSTSASSLGDKEWTSTGGNNLSFWFRDTDFNNYTGEQVASALTGQKFIYELENPIEIDLPTTMPSTIEGVQNWFADTGNIDVSFKMGVQEYIDKKIAETQALIL